MLTVNPFISTESFNFLPAVEESLFVKERNSSKHGVPALTWFKVLFCEYYVLIQYIHYIVLWLGN